jgi:parvulin-like peptidyl-prolyl isomerase
MQLTDVDKDTDAQIASAKESVPPGHSFDDELKQAGMTLDDLKQRVHDAVVVQKVVENGADLKDVQASDQEVEAIYNVHKDAFQVPPMIRASRVLILVGESDTAAQKAAKKKQIDAARARVMKGEDFSKVATEVSQDRSTAPQGGDMGKFPRNHNEPGFDDHAFNTKVNTVSPVFLDGLGYQFVKVTDSEPAGVVSLADARQMLAPRLTQEKKEEKANEYAQDLLKNSGVTFHITLVDPPAQMAPGAAPGAAPGPNGQGPDQAPGQTSVQAPDQGQAPAPDASAPQPSSAIPAPELSATNSAPSSPQ